MRSPAGRLQRSGERTTQYPGASRREQTHANFNHQENAHGRSKSTSDAGHPGPYRADQQRNGPHRPRRLPLAHVLHPGHHGARVSHRPRRPCGSGIFGALLLCLATAVAYAEISKLYPGTGSSYYYAEQALLSKDKAFKYARVAKFIVGWGSHLYYWVYPGVMVATTGIFVGYVVGFLYPNFMSGSNPGPVFMALVAVVFSFFVAWIAQKGAGASTAVNLAINVDSDLGADRLQRAGSRLSRQPSRRRRRRFQYDAQTLSTYTYQFATAKDGSTMRDASGSAAAAAGRGRQAGSLTSSLSRRRTRPATS